MTPKVSLKDVIDGLESLTEQIRVYIDKRTGKTVIVTEEELDIAESGDSLADLPLWQQESVRTAHEILQSDNFVELPDRFDLHDYAIIERFCESQENPELRNTLLNLIRGSGAFSRFYDAIHRFGIAKAWYDYRRAAYREIAIDWLEAENIPYNDDEAEPGG